MVQVRYIGHLILCQDISLFSISLSLFCLLVVFHFLDISIQFTRISVIGRFSLKGTRNDQKKHIAAFLIKICTASKDE